jgi:GNAT superfamily N-acetyltransferase
VPDRIRPARTDDLAALSNLAFRSKAHWGYDQAFMEACRDELTVREPDLQRFRVFVLEREGTTIGFGAVAPGDPEAELWWLFVEPAAIGSAAGRALLQHALGLARTLGATTLRIESDPNAEPFYLAMGAKPTGETRSQSIPGRSLPLLQCAIMIMRQVYSASAVVH